MTTENWSTILTEDDIRNATDDTAVGREFKQIPQHEHDGSNEWLRNVNAHAIYVNGKKFGLREYALDEQKKEKKVSNIIHENFAFKDDFTNKLCEKIKKENPNIPDEVIEYVIQHGAQGGFGWYGLNYLNRFVQENEDVSLEFDSNDNIINEDDDASRPEQNNVTYEITATDENALLLTVTIQNINRCSNLNVRLDPTKRLELDAGKSITVQSIFKINMNQDGKVGFACVSHQDTFINNLYEIYKANTAHVVQIKNNQNSAEAKFAYLKKVFDFIDHNRLLVDAEFKKNLNSLCESLRKSVPKTIQSMEKKINPGFFTRLARSLFPNKKITILPTAENTLPKKSSSLSRMAKLFRRKVDQQPITSQPTTPRPAFRTRVKAAVGRFVKVINRRKKTSEVTPGVPAPDLSHSVKAH